MKSPTWLYCMCLYTTTLFTVSARSQGDEVRASDWCSRSPALSTDASEDVDPEPAATVKSLIKSFDTVGQSEHSPKHPYSISPDTSVTMGDSCSMYKYPSFLWTVVSWDDLTEDGPAVRLNCCLYLLTHQHLSRRKKTHGLIFRLFLVGVVILDCNISALKKEKNKVLFLIVTNDLVVATTE